MNSKKQEVAKFIYPNIIEGDSDSDSDEFRDYYFKTILRIRHTDRKWYLQKFVRARRYGAVDKQNSVIPFDLLVESDKKLDMALIMRDVYMQTILSDVDPDFILSDGVTKAWNLDENQESEEDRLKEIRRTKGY